MKNQIVKVTLFFVVFLMFKTISVNAEKVDNSINNAYLAENVSAQNSKTQKILIDGIVVDESSEPLVGVSILIKGTSIGTITDHNGKFVLSVEPNSVLIVSYIGYEKQNISLNGEEVITIVLKESNKVLDELVVVGYGTQLKKDLTGSVSTVSGDIIGEKKITQLSTALQGTTSGVMVQRTHDAPGASSEIRIRGITTISNSNPLIIVDGISVPNIDDVNPNDVDNITVLKDAASAAIYGSRAASGVILITTKRGQLDKFSLNYSFEGGASKPTGNPGFVDVIRFMEMENELRWNDAGNGTNMYPAYPNDLIENYYSLNKENPDEYPITDWMNLILKNSALKQTHTLNVSGGTNVVKTNASFAYDYVDGLYENRNFDRISTRINNDFNINKVISASADIFFKKSSYTVPVSVPNNLMRVMPAIYPAVWSNGGIADGKGGENPYAAYLYGGTDRTEYNQIGGKISLDIKPLKGLKISGSIAPKFNFNKGKKFTKKVNHNLRTNATEIVGQINDHQQTKLWETRNDYRDMTYLLTTDYSVSLKEHKFNIMAGYESFYSFSESLGAGREAYELHEFPYLDIGPLTYRDNSGSATEIAYSSYFGRLSYNYKNRYLFQSNIRRDGSSRFHSDYRWGNFPSFSVGWNVSEESFMQKISFLSYLKLRASWGMLGNDRIGNYPYQSTIAFNPAILYQGNNVISTTGAALQKYAIRDITWETTSSLNFGINIGFFDNRLQITGDYYTKETNDMLLELEIPDYIGYENPDQNTGKMYTKGFDLEFSWRDKIGKFTYGISANLSDFISKMGDLGGIEMLGDRVKVMGSEYNEWYGYLSNGLFQTQDDLDNSPKLNNNVKLGDIKYKDISGPDGIPDGKISPDYDKVLLGGSLPRYTYGTNLYMEYMNFDFSATIQGVGKQLVRGDAMAQPLAANYKNIPDFIDGKYWSLLKTPEENLQAKYPRLSNTSATSNFILSDFWLFNGGYLRLKNINIGYTIPNELLQKISIKNLRLYFSINDFLCFNNYPKGWDPEMGSISSYPITTSYLFGLSVKF